MQTNATLLANIERAFVGVLVKGRLDSRTGTMILQPGNGCPAMDATVLLPCLLPVMGPYMLLLNHSGPQRFETLGSEPSYGHCKQCVNCS